MSHSRLGTILPAVALLPLLLLAPVLYHGLQHLQHAQVRAPDCPADLLVVMGAAQYDGQPSPAFKQRLDRALELFEAACAPNILVTGGKRDGDRYSEGEAGVRYLQARGVPPAQLMSETRSRNSLENLEFSLGLIGSRRVLIVTDDMHAYRSRWLAGYLGIDAGVAPVVTRPPKLDYALREVLMVTAYSFGFLEAEVPPEHAQASD